MSLTHSFRPHCGPGVRLLRAGAEQGLQPYHLHVPIAWKLGSLILLEPSGPAQRLLISISKIYWHIL